MIWQAIRHTTVSQFIAQVLLVVTAGILGGVGIKISPDVACVIGLVLTIAVYQLRYGRSAVMRRNALPELRHPPQR